MQAESPQSPEARRRRLGLPGAGRAAGPAARSLEIARRVVVGVYTDGFIHAGNLAYLTLIALFPFFIVAAAIAQIFGNSYEGAAAVDAFLRNVPRDVANVLRQPIHEVLTARSGHLLWLGAAVGLWTVGSLIETIRDIVRRAYGTRGSKPFWRYRLGSIGIIFVCVFAIMFAFSLQVMIGAADEFLHRVLPFADDAIALVRATRLLPAIILFLGLHYLFIALTPTRYKDRRFPKWPGAAAVTLWWYASSLLLPVVLAQLTPYNLTYGGMAGAMITLIFFFIIGLGVVIGAELNAALAEFPEVDEQKNAPVAGHDMKENLGA